MNKYTDNQKNYFSKLKVGQKIQGKIKRFTNYGAFVSVGIIDGLLATKDITWGRINDPEDFLKLHQKLEVIIIFKDEVKFNIAVGLKQLLPNPWEVAKTKYKEGDTVVGQVVDIQPYGAFLQIFPGFEGLVHVSEIYSDKKITNAKDFFHQEQAYQAVIIKLDFENKKMGLSIK
ncbi:MAG: S1 RNA-binding domain-containing protein [Bacteroidota bacterium]